MQGLLCFEVADIELQFLDSASRSLGTPLGTGCASGRAGLSPGGPLALPGCPAQISRYFCWCDSFLRLSSSGKGLGCYTGCWCFMNPSNFRFCMTPWKRAPLSP